MSKYRDFDAMFSEIKRETLTIKVFGKEYTFPATIPAAIPLELAKYDSDREIPGKTIIRFLTVMFSQPVLDEWTAHREMTVDMLGEILKTVMAMINGNDEPEIEEVTEDDGGSAPKK